MKVWNYESMKVWKYKSMKAWKLVMNLRNFIFMMYEIQSTYSEFLGAPEHRWEGGREGIGGIKRCKAFGVNYTTSQL